MEGSITPILLGLIAAALVAVIILSIAHIRLSKKLRTFMSGKDGATLESTLSWLTEKTARIDDTLEAHKEALEVIDSRVKRSIRGYSLVRYDAYGDNGGEQSFASGLLDELGNGYILSVITNRNHVGIYAKKITGGKPDTTLTEEESQALMEANQAIS